MTFVYILMASDLDSGDYIVNVFGDKKVAKKALMKICGKYNFDYYIVPHVVANENFKNVEHYDNQSYIYCPDLYLAKEHLPNWESIWQTVISEFDVGKESTLKALIDYQKDLYIWQMENDKMRKNKVKTLEDKMVSLAINNPKPQFNVQ